MMPKIVSCKITVTNFYFIKLVPLFYKTAEKLKHKVLYCFLRCDARIYVQVNPIRTCIKGCKKMFVV